MSGSTENVQKSTEYTVVDVQRVRCLNSARNRNCAPPCQDAGFDQIHHQTKTEARLDAVAFTEAPEHPLVRHARPPLLATHDQAEAIIERDARFHPGSSKHSLRLDLDDLDAESCALRRCDASHLVQHGRQDGQPSQVLRYELEYRQLGFPLVNQNICV